MKSKLLKAFRRDCEFAAKQLRLQGELGMMFIITSHDGEIIPLIVSGGEKDDAYRAVRLAAVAHDAEAVCVMAEGWALLGEPSMPTVRPEQSERRVEVVSVQMVTLEELVSSAREIIRDKDGKATGLGPERIPPQAIAVESLHGHMADLIPPVRPDRFMQASAREVLQAFSRTVLRQGGTTP